MIHMPYFLRFAKNNLHLELGVGCLYSPRIREGLFPETRPAPVLLPQDCEMLPPFHRTGLGKWVSGILSSRKLRGATGTKKGGPKVRA